jgi:hypothetical protein
MTRKLLVLTFFVMTLLFLLYSSPRVTADDCTDCVSAYFSCRNACYNTYYECLGEYGTDDICIPVFQSCQNDCDATYSACQNQHCGPGSPAVAPFGCGYSIFSLYPSLRDECIAGTSFVDVFEDCEFVPSAEREACCLGAYDYYLSTVCQCNLDPRDSTCLASPPS